MTLKLSNYYFKINLKNIFTVIQKKTHFKNESIIYLMTIDQLSTLLILQ